MSLNSGMLLLAKVRNLSARLDIQRPSGSWLLTPGSSRRAAPSEIQQNLNRRRPFPQRLRFLAHLYEMRGFKMSSQSAEVLPRFQ